MSSTFCSVANHSCSQATVLQLRDEIKTFILAGHETSAAMMTWAVYEFSKDEQCLAQAVSEAK